MAFWTILTFQRLCVCELYYFERRERRLFFFSKVFRTTRLNSSNKTKSQKHTQWRNEC